MVNTFISYSRRQYYFAESLALHLQKQGVSVWFDIQQLEPGVNWKADIDAGLAGCTSLTLVASRSAFEFPLYVEAEWKHALENHKPIFVVLYERVRLPSELMTNAVIVDFRGDFDDGVQALLAQFQHPDPRHPPNTWLPRLPPGVRRMARVMALQDLVRVVSALLGFALLVLLLAEGSFARWVIDEFAPPLLDNRIDVPTLFAVYVAFQTIRLIFALVNDSTFILKRRRFLRHDFDYRLFATPPTEPHRRSVPYLALWAWLAGSYVLFSTDWVAAFARERAQVESVFTWQGLLALLAGIIFMAWLRLIIRRQTPQHPDADIVRWATIGSVPQEWRQQVNRSVLNEQPLPSEQAVQQLVALRRLPVAASGAPLRTFQLLHAAGDEASAAKVKEILLQQGYREVDGEASYTVLILSYRTPLAFAREAVQNRAQVIGVLTTDANIPTNLPELTGLQLIDFRSGNQQELNASFRFLTDDAEAARATLSQNLLPVNLKQGGKNQDLRRLYANLLLMAGILGLYVVYWIARLALFGVPLVPLPAAYTLSAVGAAGLVLISLALVWFGSGVLHGVARLPRVLFSYGVEIPLMILAVIELATGLPPQSTVTIPVFGTNVIYVGITQAIVFVCLYSLACIRLVWTLRTKPHLLSLPQDHAFGLRVTPQWSVIIIGILFVALCVLLSLSRTI